MEKNIYNFSAKSILGEACSLSKYQEKIVLIVNVASKCGFTSQYAGLQKLYATYREHGFIVLGFPCNQFATQEPEDEKSIQKFCQVNYGVTFPLFAKIDVNGKNAHPLYKYLTTTKPGLFSCSIKWNFTKFLINRQGIPIVRYASITTPKKIAKTIETLLNQKVK
jgi:glutathione peroxidase